MKKGRAGTMTHDYKRHGVTSLFAALNVLEGKVFGQSMRRHRHQEFIRFLNVIDARVPKRTTKPRFCLAGRRQKREYSSLGAIWRILDGLYVRKPSRSGERLLCVNGKNG